MASVQTRLQKQRYGWYAVAMVSTALQFNMEREEDQYHLDQINCIRVDEDDNIFSQALNKQLAVTVLPLQAADFTSYARTTFECISEEDDSFEDIVVKPQYINEFKIKVGSLKIEKSLPKVFVD
jgi:hypothetical protein